MTQYTLTAMQIDTSGLLIDDTLVKQENVVTNEAKVVTTKAERLDIHATLHNALIELGHTVGLPDPITNLTKDLEPDGTWAGKITVT